MRLVLIQPMSHLQDRLAGYLGGSVKTERELQGLHGAEYVAAFAKTSPYRLERLVDSIVMDAEDEAVDFGCGDGMLMPLVAPRVKRYTGVDFSPEFIEKARGRQMRLCMDNVELFTGDIIGFCNDRPASFTLAFAMDFSEHVYDDDWLVMLRSMRRSMKPGGRLYMHTPNADFFVERMKASNFILKQFPEHIAVRNVDGNLDLLLKAGFRLGGLELMPHYNVLRYLHPLSRLPLIGKYMKARIFLECLA